MIEDQIDTKEFNKSFDQEKDNNKSQNVSHFIKNAETIKVLEEKGINLFSPIQQRTFKALYKRRDLIGIDRTRQGNTMAYLLPILERLRQKKLFQKHQDPKFVVIVQTNEQCNKVASEIDSLKLIKDQFLTLTICAQTSKKDLTNILKKGTDIIVTTAEGLINLLSKKEGKINLNNFLNNVDTFCLEITEQQTDIKSQQNIEKIYKYIKHNSDPLHYYPQHVIFSITMPLWIQQISRKYMKPDRIQIDLIKEERINKFKKEVAHYSMHVKNKQIVTSMKEIVQNHCGYENEQCIIFCETKKIVKDLIKNVDFPFKSKALYDENDDDNDNDQQKKQKIIKKFKLGKIICLVTNVSASSLNFLKADLVIQLRPSKNVDEYKIRSSVAGKKGVFLTIYQQDQQNILKYIEKNNFIKFKDIGPLQPDDILVKKTINVVESLKNIDQNCLDYFKDIVKQFAYDEGRDKALMRALAMLTKTFSRLKQYSVITNEQGYITYKFKAKDESEIDEKDLIQYLKEKLQQPDDSPLFNVVKNNTKKVTKSCIAFDFPELYCKKMQELELSKNNDSFTIHRVSTLSQLRIQLNKSA